MKCVRCCEPYLTDEEQRCHAHVFIERIFNFFLCLFSNSKVLSVTRSVINSRTLTRHRELYNYFNRDTYRVNLLRMKVIHSNEELDDATAPRQLLLSTVCYSTASKVDCFSQG